jgi:hypothetical protein
MKAARLLLYLKFNLHKNYLPFILASPPLQNVEHRRGRKRRSIEKYGNIVSVVKCFI